MCGRVLILNMCARKRGIRAETEFDVEKKSGAYVFFDGNGDLMYSCAGLNKITAQQTRDVLQHCPALCDLYFVATDYSWTFIQTHERTNVFSFEINNRNNIRPKDWLRNKLT